MSRPAAISFPPRNGPTPAVAQDSAATFRYRIHGLRRRQAEDGSACQWHASGVRAGAGRTTYRDVRGLPPRAGAGSSHWLPGEGSGRRERRLDAGPDLRGARRTGERGRASGSGPFGQVPGRTLDGAARSSSRGPVFYRFESPGFSVSVGASRLRERSGDRHAGIHRRSDPVRVGDETHDPALRARRRIVLLRGEHGRVECGPGASAAETSGSVLGLRARRRQHGSEGVGGEPLLRDGSAHAPEGARGSQRLEFPRAALGSRRSHRGHPARILFLVRVAHVFGRGRGKKGRAGFQPGGPGGSGQAAAGGWRSARPALRRARSDRAGCATDRDPGGFRTAAVRLIGNGGEPGYSRDTPEPAGHSLLDFGNALPESSGDGPKPGDHDDAQDVHGIAALVGVAFAAWVRCRIAAHDCRGGEAFPATHNAGARLRRRDTHLRNHPLAVPA